VFLGIGDYVTQRLDIVGYRAADFHAYTDTSMPAVTGQPYLPELVYVDKHTQPSWDATQQLPNLLQAAYGNLDMPHTAYVNAAHETGDLHVAVYDFDLEAPKLWVSAGRVDAHGDYGPGGAWKACFRPYLYFALSDLWQGA
jgi:hypothetical protein